MRGPRNGIAQKETTGRPMAPAVLVSCQLLAFKSAVAVLAESVAITWMCYCIHDNQIETDRWDRYEKFNSDNAYGSAANSLAVIRLAMPLEGPQWIICVLLCWLILGVYQVKWAIQDKV
jgi:hypothetical protein